MRSCSPERSTVTRFQSSSDGISGYLLNPDLNGAGAAFLEIQTPPVPGLGATVSLRRPRSAIRPSLVRDFPHHFDRRLPL